MAAGASKGEPVTLPRPGVIAAMLDADHLRAMKKRKRTKAIPLPLMMAELALASWETIARRTLMMAQGTCSPAEYRRMVREKAHAAHRSGSRVARGARDVSAVLAPWHKAATANAKRLRRK